MSREKVLWKLFGIKLLSYRKDPEGITGTGLLNPIISKLGLFTMIITQSKFYKKYKDLGRWKGKIVANPFAPPVGTRPQFRALGSLVKKHLFGRPFPGAMTFAVNYGCNCDCIHCSAADHIKKDEKELSTEEAKRVIDESQDIGIGVLAFTGGEPLIRKDIFELIDYVDKRKTVCLMFTNGYHLTEENVEKLADAGLYTLFVSLDSPDPEEHDRWRRTPGLFERAVEGIKMAKERGIFVGISSYASRTGTEKGYYKKMYRFAQELEVHNLILFDAVPTGSLLHDTSEMLTYDQREEITKFSSDIFDRAEKPPLSSQAWQNSIEGCLAGIGCLAVNIQYYVSAYGDVAPCDFTPLSFGNLREESLKSIWKKMYKHPAYGHRETFCRMQNRKFRSIYIDPIPEGATLPYDIDKLERKDYRKVILNQENTGDTSKEELKLETKA
jgi:MoaA/NifB/PqqE/SkfB family radical SAM enzyme